MESDNDSSDDGGGYTVPVSLSSILTGLSTHLKNQPSSSSSSTNRPTTTNSNNDDPTGKARKRGRTDDEEEDYDGNKNNSTNVLKPKNKPNDKKDTHKSTVPDENQSKRNHTESLLPSEVLSKTNNIPRTDTTLPSNAHNTESSDTTSIHPPSKPEEASAPINPYAVYIRGIPTKITDSSILRTAMEETIGKVQEAKIAHDKEGIGLGYGLVLFQTVEEANKAISLGKLSNLRYLPPSMVPHNHNDILHIHHNEHTTLLTTTSTTTTSTSSMDETTDDGSRIEEAKDITIPIPVLASTTDSIEIQTSTIVSSNTMDTHSSSSSSSTSGVQIEPKITVGGHRVSIFPCRQDLVDKWLLQPPKPTRPVPKPIVTTAKITSFTPRAVFVKKPSSQTASSSSSSAQPLPKPPKIPSTNAMDN